MLTYLLTKTVFDLHIVGIDKKTSLLWLWQNIPADDQAHPDLLKHATSLIWIGDLTSYQLATEYLSRSLFVTLVFADLLMRMNLSVWRNEKRFGETTAAQEYDATMCAMEQLFECVKGVEEK